MGTAAVAHGPGDLIAEKYLLLRVLEAGGMGEVWVAHHTLLDVHVALKFILPDAASPDADARLLREAQAAARVRHPAIVHVFDAGRTHDGECYLAMELLDGELLADVLLRERRLDPETAIRVLLPIAEALDTLHRSGSIHRDVKPENIFLARDDAGHWQPKLIDFGLARRTDPAALRLTLPGAVMGTPAYMSRQRLLGEDVDLREDVYALSVVLYQAITGEVPFDGKTLPALLAAVVENRPRSTLDHGVGDADLWAIVQRGLGPLEERWASAWDLGRALAGWAWKHGSHDDVAGTSLRPIWIGDDDVRRLAVPGPSRVPTAALGMLLLRPPTDPPPPPEPGPDPCPPDDDLDALAVHHSPARARLPAPHRHGLTVLAAVFAAVGVVTWSKLILRDARPEPLPSVPDRVPLAMTWALPTPESAARPVPPAPSARPVLEVAPSAAPATAPERHEGPPATVALPRAPANPPRAPAAPPLTSAAPPPVPKVAARLKVIDIKNPYE